MSKWTLLRLKIKIQSDKENVELDFLSLRRMIWGLLNVLILKKIWFAYFTNFWKIVCFPSLLSGLSLLKVLLPHRYNRKQPNPSKVTNAKNLQQLMKFEPWWASILRKIAHKIKVWFLLQKAIIFRLIDFKTWIISMVILTIHIVLSFLWKYYASTLNICVCVRCCVCTEYIKLPWSQRER